MQHLSNGSGMGSSGQKKSAMPCGSKAWNEWQANMLT